MNDSVAEKRLPFKDKPLRNPGQSLHRRMQDFVSDHVLAWLVAGLCLVILGLAEWIRWFFNDTIRPVPYTVVIVAVLVFVGWRVRRALRELENLRTGLLGEIHIGQFLQNKLLRRGYWVIHDIPLDDLNIDHAIIGPGGVFAIETKTRLKTRGAGKITYDGEKVLVNGIKPDRDPVAQARAVARKLEDILLKRKAVKVFVRPVVLFPGWYVEKQPKSADVWVLHEDAFVQFVDNEQPCLTKHEVFEFAAAVGMHVRDWEEKAAS
jgi:hypothetical protein